MTDLDARVAALMRKVAYYRYAPIEVADKKIMELEQAIRAELQKPALHEPVTDVEIESAIHQFLYVDGRQPTQPAMRRTLESFLQGRAKPETNDEPKTFVKRVGDGYKKQPDGTWAKPAQEEITDEQLWEIWRRLSVDMGSPIKATFVAYARAVIRASKGEKT